MSKRVAILDYGIGNVLSVRAAVEHIGAGATLTSSHEKILASDALIIPGVGAFRHGMEKLIERNLPQVIDDFVALGKPVLGICLGMQMLMESSEEFGETKGLGLIAGVVRKLDSFLAGSSVRLPHVDWCGIKSVTPSPILSSDALKAKYYFVHSFGVQTSHIENTASTSMLSNIEFASVIQNGNVFGTQFHPEKSGEAGLLILKNFIELS